MTTSVHDTTLQDSIHRFSQAWAWGDWQAIAVLTSPTYTHTDFAGETYDRDGWLDYVHRREGKPTEIEYEELAIRSFGDLAIVTGVNAIHWQTTPVTFDQRIRVTQVWRREGDRWLREAFHATMIQPE